MNKSQTIGVAVLVVVITIACGTSKTTTTSSKPVNATLDLRSDPTIAAMLDTRVASIPNEVLPKVKRDVIIAAYQSHQITFDEHDETIEGQPIIRGLSPDRYVVVEITGESQAVTNANILVLFDHETVNRPSERLKLLELYNTLADSVLDGWSKRKSWIKDSVDGLISASVSKEFQYERKIKLKDGTIVRIGGNAGNGWIESGYLDIYREVP